MPLFDLGLVAIAGWALSQLIPLVPSLDAGNLRAGIAPIWHTLQRPDEFLALQCAAYALDIAGLALLAKTLGNPGRGMVTVFFAFVAMVLAYKIPVVGRQLSLGAVAGALIAAALTPLFVVQRAMRSIGYRFALEWNQQFVPGAMTT